MRIVVDATSLLLPGLGVRTHIHYWLTALLKAATRRGDTISAYLPGITASPVLDHRTSVSGWWSTQLRLRAVQSLNVVPWRRNPALNLFMVGADLFHCSQHTKNIPIRKTVTATAFDFSCWRTPQYHTAANIAATHRYGRVVLRACDGVIANSRHTQQDAVDILGIPKRRIRVIYPGVSAPFFDVTAEDALNVRAKYSLTLPYLLFAGCIEPRKNVGSLIGAYQRMRRSIRRDVELVLVGQFGWAGEEVRSALSSSGDLVRHLGYVSEPDMPGLFRGAAAFVYPSFYEGFGLPLAQAMAAGTPVVTSLRSCIPEVVGDAALCVDPTSEEKLEAAMERVLSDTELARALSSRGKARAQRFHWDRAATESLQFFHECYGSYGP